MADWDINLGKLRNCLPKQCTVSLYWGAYDRLFELIPIYRHVFSADNCKTSLAISLAPYMLVVLPSTCHLQQICSARSVFL